MISHVPPYSSKFVKDHDQLTRDQARGRLGRNGRPRSQNFALNGTKGEVGVSLKKKFFFFFFRETYFHSVTTQMQAVTLYYHLNGNSMCNG